MDLLDHEHLLLNQLHVGDYFVAHPVHYLAPADEPQARVMLVAITNPFFRVAPVAEDYLRLSDYLKRQVLQIAQMDRVAEIAPVAVSEMVQLQVELVVVDEHFVLVGDELAVVVEHFVLAAVVNHFVLVWAELPVELAVALVEQFVLVWAELPVELAAVAVALVEQFVLVWAELPVELAVVVPNPGR